MRDRLIVALDKDDGEEIDRLSGTLMESVSWFKIGFQAFSVLGMEVFPLFEQNGYKTFVDLKIHDIPNRVARDVGTMTKHGANMITLHASGGFEMMQAARHGADDAAYKANIPKPILLGVTVLTSMDEIGFQETFGSERQLPEQVTYPRAAGKESRVGRCRRIAVRN